MITVDDVEISLTMWFTSDEDIWKLSNLVDLGRGT